MDNGRIRRKRDQSHKKISWRERTSRWSCERRRRLDSCCKAQEAIGHRFHAVLVDNGLLCLDEAAIVKETLTKHLGVNLVVVDASERFLGKLKGIKDDPEQKRKIIGNTFI
jgi:GMP synthase PP-ATPase subunit